MQNNSTPSHHRVRIAAIPIDKDELVVSVDDAGMIDVRLWTMTGVTRFPSKHGISFPRCVARDVLDAIRLAMTGETE